MRYAVVCTTTHYVCVSRMRGGWFLAPPTAAQGIKNTPPPPLAKKL